MGLHSGNRPASVLALRRRPWQARTSRRGLFGSRASAKSSECRRINAALAYALEHKLPVEWFAVSSGALIAMDSGTENMDWIALTLRRLIEYTQAGGEVNIVVTGINVGGQPYSSSRAARSAWSATCSRRR
jgi:hypothetical protein